MCESQMSKELQRRVFEVTLALYRVTDFFSKDEILRKQLREKANEIFACVTEYGYSVNSEHDASIVIGKIHTITGFLGVARSLQIVKVINLTVLEREYNFLANFFTRELENYKKEEEIVNNQRIVKEIKPKKQTKAESPEAGELPTWQEFSNKNLPEIKEAAKNGGVPNEPKSASKTELTSFNINNRQKSILEYLKQTKQAKISDFYSSFSAISSKTIQRDLQSLVAQNLLKKEGEKRWTIYSLLDRVNVQ